MPLPFSCSRPLLRLVFGLVGLSVTWGGLPFGFSAGGSRAAARTLRVGVSGSAPFVISQGPSTQGISVDVWRDFASAEGLPYELLPQISTAASIENVATGDLDVAIGPISITPDRLMIEGVEFTQPYFISHVGLLVSDSSPGLWRRIRPFFGWAALSSAGVLLICLFTVGNLIWLAEHRTNPDHFPRHYLRGVGNGMWFALVTLTTVGYGDRAPVTGVGRWISGVWMVVSLIAVSSITAGLASAFTISLARLGGTRLSEPSDLSGAPVAVVRGTTSVKWGTQYGAQLTQADSLEEAISLLRANRVEGVIFDRPALKYHLLRNQEQRLKLAPFSLATEPYGIVIPSGSSLERPLDVALVRMQRLGRTREIVDRWIEGLPDLGPPAEGA
ncbi:transporter substrate-binding domain-containing protein [Synechococcus sp. CS-1329]|uniref:transporter substrate-binding domain-containing protein n=1 Tax=Synechococcus sp. CS-1329 TaxID=2847975 RepID=UPI00223ACC09|nr:transporter substrate-binding domain-containing protein [Synechococcus sp. CS-1329]MCT0219770.1 transporter substrate-binding domain-containing protein [Synechococcus sp. CS-1329]